MTPPPLARRLVSTVGRLLHLLTLTPTQRRERVEQLRVLRFLVAYDRERAAWERLQCLERCTRFGVTGRE